MKYEQEPPAIVLTEDPKVKWQDIEAKLTTLSPFKKFWFKVNRFFDSLYWGIKK